MKKFLTFLMVVCIMGFTLYLKPGFKFQNGTDNLKIKYVSSEGVVASIGQSGRIIKVTGEDGKRYYVPVDNILYIIED